MAEPFALFSYFPDYRPDCEDNAQRQPGEGADQLDRQIGFQHKCLLSGIEKPPCRLAWWFLTYNNFNCVAGYFEVYRAVEIVKAVLFYGISHEQRLKC